MLLDRRALAVLGAVLGSVWAQGGSFSTVNVSMCNWAQLRANTIRDTVYLDGGYLWWQYGLSNGKTTPYNDDNAAGLIYTLDLGSTFDTTTTNLTGLFSTMPKAAGSVANNIAPNYRDGVMFANDYEFYLYGGLLRLTNSSDAPSGDTVLGYEKYQYSGSASAWQPGFINANLDTVTRYVTNGAGVSAPSENLGFYFSGMHAPSWGPIYVNDESANTTSQRMIKADLSEMRDTRWSNLSLPSYVPGRTNAEAVWIPVSDSGILVIIGGVTSSATIFQGDGLSAEQQDESKKQSPGFMETVSVYDIAHDQWYNQNTTGDTPPALTQFCSVYASASDGSSHNIYIYGGYDGLKEEDTPSDDVYVLSLPSFEWIKVYSGDSAHGRYGHKCVKPYPDKMLVLGGKTAGDVTCVDGGIIQVFNLNTARFQNTYSPTDWSEYQVPSLVSGRIGGNPKGGASKTSPSSWTNSSLASVFSTKYPTTIKTYYPYTSTTSTTPSISIIPAKNKSTFPGWAGAIIGVVVGLLLIAAAATFWLLLLRRRKQRRESTFTVDSGKSRFSRWMYAGASSVGGDDKGGDLGMSEPAVSAVAYGYGHGAHDGEESNFEPGSAVSPGTNEAGSEPVYEMPDRSTAAPVELPTPYNHDSSSINNSNSNIISPVSNELNTPVSDNLNTPISQISQMGNGNNPSPVSPEATPRIYQDDPQPSPPLVRPDHRRHVSSLSSVQSTTISNVMRGDMDGRMSPGWVSVSDLESVSSDGPRGDDSGYFFRRESRLETTREVEEK